MAATTIITHKNYIGGQWVESVTGRTYQVHNPAHKDQIVGEFQTSGADDALRAVVPRQQPCNFRRLAVAKGVQHDGVGGDEGHRWRR